MPKRGLHREGWSLTQKLQDGNNNIVDCILDSDFGTIAAKYIPEKNEVRDVSIINHDSLLEHLKVATYSSNGIRIYVPANEKYFSIITKGNGGNTASFDVYYKTQKLGLNVLISNIMCRNKSFDFSKAVVNKELIEEILFQFRKDMRLD